MLKSRLVTNPKQVFQNIKRFSEELSDSLELQDRLAYSRAWYAHRDDKEIWHFGPSKFCGYQNMTAKEYLNNDDTRDGRRTERQLAQWFTEVPDDNIVHEELTEKLTSFLATYDKIPSAKMRINVASEFYETFIANENGQPDQAMADLIIAAVRNLPKAERDRVKRSLSRSEG